MPSRDPSHTSPALRQQQAQLARLRAVQTTHERFFGHSSQGFQLYKPATKDPLKLKLLHGGRPTHVRSPSSPTQNEDKTQRQFSLPPVVPSNDGNIKENRKFLADEEIHNTFEVHKMDQEVATLVQAERIRQENQDTLFRSTFEHLVSLNQSGGLQYCDLPESLQLIGVQKPRRNWIEKIVSEVVGDEWCPAYSHSTILSYIDFKQFAAKYKEKEEAQMRSDGFRAQSRFGVLSPMRSKAPVPSRKLHHLMKSKRDAMKKAHKVRPVSKGTLIRAALQSKDLTSGSVLWREENILKELNEREKINHTLAEIRLEQKRVVSDQGRARAKRFQREKDKQFAERRAQRTQSDWAATTLGSMSTMASMTASAHSHSDINKKSILDQDCKSGDPLDITNLRRKSKHFHEDMLFQKRGTMQSGQIPELSEVPEDNENNNGPVLPPSHGAKSMLPKLRSSVHARLRAVTLMQKEAAEVKRVQKIIDDRKAKFESLPAADKEALKKTFEQYDVDGSGLLDAGELRDCLADLGLKGKSEAEKKEITMLLTEVGDEEIDFYNFCFEIVPKARTMMRDLHRPALFEQFCEVDADGSGMLSTDEAKETLKSFFNVNMDESKVAATLKSEFDSIIKEIKCERMNRLLKFKRRGLDEGFDDVLQDLKTDGAESKQLNRKFQKGKGAKPGAKEFSKLIQEHDDQDGDNSSNDDQEPGDDELNFDDFQDLIERVQERAERLTREREREIVVENNIEETVFNNYRGELIPLYESFLNFDQDKSGKLDQKEIRLLLLEFGLLPKDMKEQQLQEHLRDLIRRHDQNGDMVIDFKEFLAVVGDLREETRHQQADELRTIFDKFDKDHSGDLSLAEVSKLLNDLGLQPRTRSEQDEIKKLLEETDEDGSGELCFGEFEVLVAKIQEKFRKAQRDREIQTAIGLGFSQSKVIAIRDAFFSLDADGKNALNFDELRRAAMLLRLRMDEVQLQHLFKEIDQDGSGLIDFDEFLILMKQIDDEHQQQIRAALAAAEEEMKL